MKFTKEFLEEHYIRQHKSFKTIGKETGVSESNVIYWANQHNIQRRPQKVLIDLIGQKFGKLTVLERVPNPGYTGGKWLCKCECGKTKKIVRSSLINGLTKSCGCDRFNKMWKGFGGISGCYWTRIVRGAISRNLKISITIIDAWNKYVTQKGLCALSGKEIFLVKDLTRNRVNNTASLDRIDNKEGYTIDNIQWVHRELNILRGTMPIPRLLYWIKNIYENLHLENYSEQQLLGEENADRQISGEKIDTAS